MTVRDSQVRTDPWGRRAQPWLQLPLQPQTWCSEGVCVAARALEASFSQSPLDLLLMLLEEGPPWGLWLWRSAKMTKAGGAGYTGARRQAVGSGRSFAGTVESTGGCCRSLGHTDGAPEHLLKSPV